MKVAYRRYTTRRDVSSAPAGPLSDDLAPKSHEQRTDDECDALTSSLIFRHADREPFQTRCASSHDAAIDTGNRDHSVHIKSARLPQLLRFCAVGLMCLALSAAILAALHEFAGVNYLLAYVVTFIVANIVGYILNARLTFPTHSASHSGAVRYILVNAVLLCINVAVLGFLVSRLHFWYMAAAILLAGVNSPMSFVAQRLVTYHPIMQNRSHDT